MNKIARLGDPPLDLTGQLDAAHKAEQELETFNDPGIYFVIREGEDVIRNRSFKCDIHELTEEQVTEMAYEFAHTIMKIKKRKVDKELKEQDLNNDEDEKTNN